MTTISKGGTPPERITIELSGLTINGLPPSGKDDQPCILILKTVRQHLPDEKSWTQLSIEDFSYCHILLINKGSEELENLDLGILAAPSSDSSNQNRSYDIYGDPTRQGAITIDYHCPHPASLYNIPRLDTHSHGKDIRSIQLSFTRTSHFAQVLQVFKDLGLTYIIRSRRIVAQRQLSTTPVPLRGSPVGLAAPIMRPAHHQQGYPRTQSSQGLVRTSSMMLPPRSHVITSRETVVRPQSVIPPWPGQSPSGGSTFLERSLTADFTSNPDYAVVCHQTQQDPRSPTREHPSDIGISSSPRFSYLSNRQHTMSPIQSPHVELGPPLRRDVPSRSGRRGASSTPESTAQMHASSSLGGGREFSVENSQEHLQYQVGPQRQKFTPNLPNATSHRSAVKSTHMESQPPGAVIPGAISMSTYSSRLDTDRGEGQSNRASLDPYNVLLDGIGLVDRMDMAWANLSDECDIAIDAIALRDQGEGLQTAEEYGEKFADILWKVCGEYLNVHPN